MVGAMNEAMDGGRELKSELHRIHLCIACMCMLEGGS